jgi:hypothetical protein
MSTAFVPKHFPRTRLTSGCVLSDAQQYQYDVLRSVGGKLIKGRDAWYREVPYTDVHQQTGTVREKIYGLNLIAMFKLVEVGLAECGDDAASGGYLFLLPDLAKDMTGRRYVRINQVVKEKAPS